MKKALIIILISLFYSLAGATDSYYFKSLNVQNGLSQNTVNTIMQDSRGFLWFGTKDGLNRYDGYRFKVYKNISSEDWSLRNNFIRSLHEDSDGNIWVGTDEGLDVFYPKEETFHHICTTPNGRNNHQSVNTIAEAPNGDIWVSIESLGLFRFSDSQSIPVFFSAKDFPCLSSVSSICFDQKGTIWFASFGKGLFYSSDQMQSVNAFMSDDGQEILKGDFITRIVPAHYNNLVVGSLKSGVWIINLLNGDTERILVKDKSGNDIRCRDLLFSSKQELLVGTESGLFIYDISSRESSHFKSSYYDPLSLSANAIYSMCEDTEGALWLGTYFGGVNYHSPASASFEKFYPENGDFGLKGKRIREICKDKQGTFWIGTEDGGLHRFNAQEKLFSQFSPSLSFNNIHGLCLIDDNLWVGTISKGLKIIDIRTNRIIKSYENSDSAQILNDNNIYSIFQSKQSEIYVGTQFGLMRYDKKNDAFIEIAELAGKHVYDIKEDVKGNLWVATYSSGVWCYKVLENEWKQYLHDETNPNSLPHNIVLSVFVDSSHKIWFTTQGGGCCRYDEENDAFLKITTEDGLPDNIVYQIIEDEIGNLWISTSKGLACITPESNSVVSLYTIETGLLSEQFNYKSSFKDKDGTIYLGSIQGLIAFNPSKLQRPISEPKITITDFSLLGQDTNPHTEESPLVSSIDFTENLVLNYNQNSFSFRITAPNHISPQAKQIEFMLEGFDNDWQSGEPSPIASYSNLRHGNYVLRARMKSNLQLPEESNNEIELKIRIRPPFYLSIIAQLLYVIAFIGVFVGINLNIKRRNSNRYKMELAKMEQEKERAIYDSKIEFFTNIAHEIRTPLTLINGPLENILNNESLQDETKEELEIMKQNTERLIDLTNQLLDFNKMESKKYTLSFKRANINALLHELVNRFSALAKQKEIKLSLEMPEENIYADISIDAFSKIIGNLLSNGLKYSNSYLNIRLESFPDLGCFNVTTENDGVLVPDEIKEEIFKPFIRYKENAEDKAIMGTGIGLGLSRSLATLHQGSLRMLNDIKANVFQLSLPIIQQETMSIKSGTVKNSETIIPDNSKKISILVVEDDAELMSFIVKQLQNDYNIYSAGNGITALKIVDNYNIDLIVSDVMMPEMNGFDLCEAIKSNIKYSHIPLILLTAKTDIQSKVEGMELGADNYIEKPFSTKYLKACISNLLDNREKLRKIFTQSPLSDSKILAHTKADEEFINHLNEVIEQNYSNSEFSMDDMAKEFNMSRASFYRKISGLIDMSPNDYLRFARLKKAAQLFKDEKLRVNEACYLVGFNSPSYFAKCFQKQFGISPKDFLENYNSKKSNNKNAE